MFTQANLNLLIQVVLIAAALNWGLVAYNGTDLVKLATGGGDIEKYAKFAVAAAGAYATYLLYLAVTKQ